MEAKAKCRACGAEILAATANRTGGVCMPCSQGARYAHLAYLSIDDFFSKASDEYCLAPNLEPHPTISEFKAKLKQFREGGGVSDLLIPVDEFQNPEKELDPSSDRVLIIGTVDEKIVADWADKLGAEFYQEPRPGAEVPLDVSKAKPVWCIVWD